MKIAKEISELKKLSEVIVKGDPAFLKVGHTKISGEVYSVDQSKGRFLIKCRETGKIETIHFGDGDTFLIYH